MSFTTFIIVLLTFLFIYYNTADSEILWLYGSIRSSPSSVYHRRGREVEHPVISKCSVHQRPVKVTCHGDEYGKRNIDIDWLHS